MKKLLTVIFLFMILIEVLPRPSYAVPQSSSELRLDDALLFYLYENLTVTDEGSIDVAILIQIPDSPLADIYREALGILERDSEQTEIPYDKKVALNVNLDQTGVLDAFSSYESDVLVPVREKFYEGLCQEHRILLGLNLTIASSKVVPKNAKSDCEIYIDGKAFPGKIDVESLADKSVWNISIGALNPETFSGLIYAKTSFIHLLLSQLNGWSKYIGKWIITIILPSGATLVNDSGLNGLRCCIDLGGDNLFESYVCVEGLTIVLSETLIVTKNETTLLPSEFYEAIKGHEIFNIVYECKNTLILPSIKDQSCNGEKDFSWIWDIPLFDEQWRYDFLISDFFNFTLNVHLKLGIQGYIGWDPTFPIFGLNWFEAWIKPHCELSLDYIANVTVEYSNTFQKTLLPTTTLLSYTIWIGIIPVTVDINFDINASLHVSFKGQLIISGGAKAFGWIKAGVQWRNSKWDYIWEPYLQMDYIEPRIEFEANATVRPSLTFKLAALFWKSVGPFIEVEPYAEANVMFIPNLKVEISAGIDITAGITFGDWLKFLGLKDWKWPVAKYVLFNWTWKPRHDVAVTLLQVSKYVIYQGETVQIDVMVENQGSFYEEFQVSLYCKSSENNIEKSLIGQQDVSLNKGASKKLHFSWDTKEYPYGNYTLWAEVGPLDDEEDTMDNQYIYFVEITPVDFFIWPRSERFWYPPGDIAKVFIEIENRRTIETTFWIGVSFKDPVGKCDIYDPQINVSPNQTTLLPKENAMFEVTWMIPSNVPAGKYEIAVNCWKDNQFRDKFIDNIEWIFIFYVYPETLDIKKPTEETPIRTGSPDKPRNIEVIIESVPIQLLDPTRRKLPLINVEIGGKKASCELVPMNLDENTESICYGLYVLNVTPPLQAEEGYYNLSVTFTFNLTVYRSFSENYTINYIWRDVEKNAVEYSRVVPIEPVDKALQWLRERQNNDGSWTYFDRKNVGLTALCSLAFINVGILDKNVTKALDWILSQRKPEGSISAGPGGPPYREDVRVYDTSLAILALVAARRLGYSPENVDLDKIINNAVNFLIQCQCVGPSFDGYNYGYADLNYGGWGYPRYHWADLSNTQFVVLALHEASAAGISLIDKKVWESVAIFTIRCLSDPSYNPKWYRSTDGGFKYRPDEDRSRGSMTGAGVWTLGLCKLNGIESVEVDGVNVPLDNAIQDGLNWLNTHGYVDNNYPLGGTWYYYYLLSVSKGYIITGKGEEWYDQMLQYLIDIQSNDGHWPSRYWEEPDILATVFATLAIETRMEPTKLKESTYLSFYLYSNAFIRITDPLGRVVGYNYVTLQGENDIPTAVYSGPYMDPQFVIIVDPVMGNYSLELLGISVGPFELIISANYGAQTIDTYLYKGWVNRSRLYAANLQVARVTKPINIYPGPIEFKRTIEITASITIEPNILKLLSRGKWIVAHIELPGGYNVNDINIASIMLNGTIPVDLTAPYEIGDYNNDSIPDLMVKFNRTAVSELILSKGIKCGSVTLTVAGRLYDGTEFEGSDTIRVRMLGDINMDGMVDMKDISIVARAFGSYPNHPRWNPIADENEDDKIDMFDIALVARNFGKTYT